MKIPEVVIRSARRVVRLPARRSRLEVFLVALLLLVSAGSASAIVVHRITDLPSGAVYRAQGTVMTQQEFAKRLHILTAVYGVQVPRDAATRDKFNRTAAKTVAVTDIVDRAARAQGIVITDSSARDKLNAVIQQTQGGRDAFVAQLGALGLSEGDVLGEIKRTLSSTELFGRMTAKTPQVGEQQVKDYYAAHTKDMAEPEKREIRNIVVSSKDAAAQVLAKAKAGTDFATLAQQSSADQSTKTKGGDIGSVSAAQLEKPYADTAFAAPRGGLFGPVQTQHGWNVGQIVSITPAKPRTLAQVHDELRDELQQQAKAKVWSQWLAGAIRSAAVEYASAYRPADPDSPPRDITK